MEAGRGAGSAAGPSNLSGITPKQRFDMMARQTQTPPKVATSATFLNISSKIA